ncbi:MAG TPA: sulfur carrier protein ThiS [Rectinemataceae bacterium]|nr:sulfur carrier protein ThiS [Rectinemataceae bacterium]
MKLTINFSEETHEEDGLSVASLIAKKRWSFPLIIARVNGELVEREDYATTSLVDGDEVELYHLVSGG